MADKKELQEKAESLGIKFDGRWSEKRLIDEIAKVESDQPELIESVEPEPVLEAPEQPSEPETDSPKPVGHIESGDLLRMLAEQRKKHGLANYANKGKPKKRRSRSKIHGNAVDAKG